MSEPNQPKRPNPYGYDDLEGADIPTYNRKNTDKPLDSDAPTTVFSPTTSSGASDYDPADLPTAYQPAGGQTAMTEPAPPEQPTMALSFSNSEQPSAQDLPAAAAAAPADTAMPTPAPVQTSESDARRGTMDFGIFLIRIAAALYLMIDSIGTFFELGSRPGLSGLEQAYNGYAYPSLLAIAVPSAELIAGVFLLLGLLTPIAAAIGTVATTFTFLHTLNIATSGLNIFAFDAAVILAAVLLLMMLGLQFTGPGKLSLDYARSWAARPLVSSWVFVVLAIAGAVALWWFGAGVNPLP